MQVYPHQFLVMFQDSICSCKNVIEPHVYSESDFLPGCPGNDSLEHRGTITVPLLQNIGYIGTQGVANAVSSTQSISTWICSYASVISIFDRYVFQVSESMIKHMSSIGVMSNTEFAFLFLASITVCNELSFFARQSRGHAMVEGFLTHHSACSYHFAFS